jgi:hypothetical protein
MSLLDRIAQGAVNTQEIYSSFEEGKARADEEVMRALQISEAREKMAEYREMRPLRKRKAEADVGAAELDVEAKTAELPAKKAEARLRTKEAGAGERLLPLKEQNLEAQYQSAIRESLLTVKDEELEDVAVLLGSVTNQQEYNMALGAIKDRHGDAFDPSAYGLTDQFDENTSKNVKFLTTAAVNNLPHMRAKELQNLQYDNAAALAAFKDDSKSKTLEQLRAEATMKMLVNEKASAAGQALPFELTPGEDAMARTALKDPNVSMALDLVSTNIPAFTEALKGDVTPLVEALHGALNTLDKSYKYRNLSEEQKLILEEGRARYGAAKTPEMKRKVLDILLNHGISKDLL